MKGWKNLRLKEFCEFKYGKNLPEHSRVKGLYPVYGSSSVISYHNQFLVKGPGIIVGRKGTVGKVQFSKSDFFPIDTTFFIEAKEDKADIKFLYYRLSLCGLEDMNSDAAVPGLNRDAASSLKIFLPPLPTQKKIAGILSAYDDAIENNLRRIKLLEEMAQITYEEWFVRLRFPGHTTTPINKTTGLPDGWKKKQIKDIGEVVTGKTPSTTNQDFFGDEVPFIKTPDMANAPYVISTTQSLSRLGANSQKNKYLPKNSLMVSCIGTAGATGLVAVASQTNQQINSIVFKDSAYCFFMYCFSRGLKPLLEGLGSNGATMTNVNKTKFEGIEFDCPAQDILVSYNAKVSLNFESILNLQYQNQRLREARYILLPRLMTGVIDAEKYQPENFLKKN